MIANPRPRSGDIVVRCGNDGSFRIKRIDGGDIGTSHDRLDAMRRACEAARVDGGYVWISDEGVPEVWREIICP